MLEKVLKKNFKIKKFHGSRDYFQIRKNGFTYEIVPILAINKAADAKNITDVSMLHTGFVKKHKQVKNEIRLMKKFARGIGVYGAESHINGFSGYVIEILTINYNGFLNALRAISKWREKEFIDVSKYYRNKEDIKRNLNESKLISPLIVVDPVDKNRNAAAAIDEEKFSLFVKKAKEFLKKPSIKFFEEKKIEIKDIKKKYKGKNLVILRVKGKLSKPDVTGTKILKVYDFVFKGMEDFKVKERGWSFDEKTKALLWYVLKEKKLGKVEIVSGPPVKMDEYVKDLSLIHI